MTSSQPSSDPPSIRLTPPDPPATETTEATREQPRNPEPSKGRLGVPGRGHLDPAELKALLELDERIWREMVETTTRHRLKRGSAVYDLNICQEPGEGRTRVPTKKNGRPAPKHPLDPPPIIEFTLHDGDTTKSYLHSPNWFCLASVHSFQAEDDGPAEVKPDVITGTLASSLHRVKMSDNRDHGFFVFGDLYPKQAGEYRLQFDLFEMRQGPKPAIPMYACHVKTIVAGPLKVHAIKGSMPVRESTALSKALSDAGVKLRIRKEATRRKMPQTDWRADGLEPSAWQSGMLPLPSAMVPSGPRLQLRTPNLFANSGEDVTQRLSYVAPRTARPLDPIPFAPMPDFRLTGLPMLLPQPPAIPQGLPPPVVGLAQPQLPPAMPYGWSNSQQVPALFPPRPGFNPGPGSFAPTTSITTVDQTQGAFPPATFPPRSSANPDQGSFAPTTTTTTAAVDHTQGSFPPATATDNTQVFFAPNTSVDLPLGLFAPTTTVGYAQELFKPTTSVDHCQGIFASKTVDHCQGMFAPTTTIDRGQGMFASTTMVDHGQGMFAPTTTVEHAQQRLPALTAHLGRQHDQPGSTAQAPGLVPNLTTRPTTVAFRDMGMENQFNLHNVNLNLNFNDQLAALAPGAYRQSLTANLWPQPGQHGVSTTLPADGSHFEQGQLEGPR